LEPFITVLFWHILFYAAKQLQQPSMENQINNLNQYLIN